MDRLVVHNKDEIPDEQYRRMLLTLMDKQAGREIAGAEVFGQCLIFAPTWNFKMELVRFQAEELRHFKLVAALMEELGVDMEAYVRNHARGESRFTGNAADLQVEDWIDAVLFNFMTDRAAIFQLGEYAKGSYLPLAQANQTILREETEHKNFGEICVVEMCRDPKTRDQIQRRLSKWFDGSMRIFGRAGTAGNRYCISVGLKTRDSGEVAADFVSSIRPVLAQCGLRFPDPRELGVELPAQVDLSIPAPGAPPHQAHA